MAKKVPLERSGAASGTSLPSDQEDPLEAYEQSRESMVYRLSEAMFASLLASYIIGFATWTHEIWSDVELSNWTWQQVSDTSNRLFVSLVFAFLTTAIYVKYNMAILTLHTYSLRIGARDFALAVAQGIFFGLTMVWPILLPLCVAIVFAGGMVILWHETGQLTTALYNTQLCREFVASIERDDVQRAPKRRRAVRWKIRSFMGECHSEWEIPSFRLMAFVIGVLVIGAGLPLVAYFLRSNNGMVSKEVILHCSVGVNFVVLIVILVNSYRISSDGGEFLRMLRRGDRGVEYAELKRKVGGLRKEAFEDWNK